MVQSPCQNCKSRNPSCHDKCEEYIAYHDELVAAKAALRGDDGGASGFLIDAVEKRRKKRRSK